MVSETIRVICLGDVVGRPGRVAVKRYLPELVKSVAADLVIVNAENSSGGLGIVSDSAEELRSAGVNLITLGDHTWQRKEAKRFLERESGFCIRPANYPEGAPGQGHAIIETGSGLKVGVFNLLGRVFINGALDCPFRKADEILSSALSECKIVICDFHAEATSEKIAMGYHLDGRISFLFGTHSHVQTADNRVLAGGTGFISDLGMCGSVEGVLGMDVKVALGRFLTGMPHTYKVAKGNAAIKGAVTEIDIETGKALTVERISIPG